MDDKIKDQVAKALWECEPHHLMKKAGHAVDWPNLNKAVKKDMLRKAEIAVNAYLLAQEKSWHNTDIETAKIDLTQPGTGPCIYWDSGFCYAPAGLNPNAVNGSCLNPSACSAKNKY